MLSDATLLFDVELIEVGDAPPQVNVFKAIDKDEDNKLSKEEVRGGLGPASGVACGVIMRHLS